MLIPSRTRVCSILLALGFGAAISLSAADAAKTNAAVVTQSPADAEAAYAKVIDERAAKIVTPLKIEDPAKSAKIHSLLVAQYRALRDWHDANDAARKKANGDELAKINASLTGLHDKFIASLNAELTPEQVEGIKDGMTYGKVQFTFKGYLIEYPDLNEAQQQKVLELLKEAREVAMDGGSADEKSAIFNKYKGKINNWLSKQGVASSRQKKTAAAATNSPPVKQ